MTVYSAGAINGVELIQSINGVDIDSIRVINAVWVEHMPLQTVIYYHGTISGAASKSTEFSSMPGWYVCNGIEPTDYVLDDPPDYINTPRFLRGMSTVDDTGGGNDTKVVLSHSHSSQNSGAHYGHTASSTCDSHTHQTIQLLSWYNSDAPPLGTGHQPGSYMRTFSHGDFVFLQGTSAHSHTVSSSGNHSSHSIGNSGSVSPNNRPVYRTLIPLIRLRRTNYTFAVGTILWFDGSFSNGNGWYKCDGNNGTIPLQNNFIRGDPVSNGSGGTDTAVNTQHNHTITTSGNHNHDFSTHNGHTHTYSTTCWGYVSDVTSTTTTNIGGGKFPREYIYTTSAGGHDHSGDLYTNNHTHVTNSTGTGDSDNRPVFYSMQLVQRVS